MRRLMQLLDAYERMTRAVERQSIATSNWYEWILQKAKAEQVTRDELTREIEALRVAVRELQEKRKEEKNP